MGIWMWKADEGSDGAGGGGGGTTTAVLNAFSGFDGEVVQSVQHEPFTCYVLRGRTGERMIRFLRLNTTFQCENFA